MKPLILLLTFVVLFFNSCDDKPTNEPNVSLTGNWLVKEQYADPGDGSGTYHPVSQTPQQFIRFRVDGTLESNYFTFSLSTIKSYQLIDSTRVKFISADKHEVTYRYKIEGKRLTLNPPCIEGCGIRLIKSE